VWLLLAGLATCLLVLRATPRRPFFRPHGAVLAFLLLAVTSATWSIDPPVTVRRALSLAATAAAACFLRSSWGLDGVLRLVQRFATVCVVASFAWAFVSAEAFEAGGRLRGVFFLKNQLGLVAAIAVVTSVVGWLDGTHQRRRVWLAASACASAVVVLLTNSVTSIAATLIGSAAVVAVALLRRTDTRRAASGAFFVLAGLATAVVSLAGTSLLLRPVGRDPLLSGRADLWRALAGPLGDHPLAGWGYGAFWTAPGSAARQVVRTVSWEGVPPASAHNGLLEGWLALGALGALLLLAVVGSLAVSGVRHCRAGAWSEGAALLGFAAFVATYNLAESDLLRSRSLLTLLVVALTAVHLGRPAGVRVD
jgi:exopolysaccharide production protein ExoQ